MGVISAVSAVSVISVINVMSVSVFNVCRSGDYTLFYPHTPPPPVPSISFQIKFC